MTIEEAHFSLTAAIATRKDVFFVVVVVVVVVVVLPWVFRKVGRSQGSFVKSKEND